jgi:hypothetical protein
MLQRFITPHGGFVCNVCNSRQPAFTVMFGCRTCDYDACGTCQATAATPSAPTPAARPTITPTTIHPIQSPTSWTSTSVSTNPYATTTSFATPLPQAKFLSDVTLPDGTFLDAGARVVKIWRVKNSSASETWPAGTKLVHVGGDLLGGPVQGVPVPCVKPGDTVDVQVPFVMPSAPGRYTSYWRLAQGSPTFARFGHRFWCQLTVADAPPSGAFLATLVATPPTSIQLSPELQASVQQCVELGFTDVDRVVKVLGEVQGDVQRAVDVLLTTQASTASSN